MENPQIIETKKINYKGKIKEIPVSNSNPKLCEYFLIAKMRYCKFDKFTGSEFCVYHTSNDDFAICPFDPLHRILKEHYKKHIKVCNILQDKEKVTKNPWYVKDINAISQDNTKEEFNKIHEAK
jgi:hypothetical protein